MMLSIDWETYKRIIEDFRKGSAVGFSATPNYVKKGNNYVIYFATPDFEYRCIVPVSEVSRIDASEFITFGYKINGRVK